MNQTYMEPTNEQNVMRKLGIIRLFIIHNRLALDEDGSKGLKVPDELLTHFMPRRDIIHLYRMITKHYMSLGQFELGTDCVDYIKMLVDHKGDVSIHRYINEIDITDNYQLRALCELLLGLPVVYNPRCGHFYEQACDKLGIPHHPLREDIEEDIYRTWLTTHEIENMSSEQQQ